MENIKEFLQHNLKLPFKTLIYDEVLSTNTLCKELSRREKEDLAVIALSQSGGKGRLGRSFYSPKGSGTYISFLLHPKLNANESVKITTAAAVAAASAIDFISGKHSLIKWVNDIYLGGKKVCGILTEASFSGKGAGLDYAVLGIGLNLYDPENGFPQDIKEKAGSVFGKNKRDIQKTAEFITEFTRIFHDIYKKFPESGYMEEYRNRSMLNGKEVYFIKDGREVTGKVLGIDDNTQLLLETDSGVFPLLAGEVSLKTKS